MMWRTMDSTHPAHDPVADAPYRNVIEELYVEADDIVGETLRSIDDDATLIVMSDHGFTSWTRAFNLNTWLRANGYIAFKNRSDEGGTGCFARGVRGSDESALGTIAREIITDNTGKWSGDHLMDHEAVPGVLLTNRPLQRTASSLKELGAAVLAEFGIEGFPSSGN
jgi:predicted AlkP superfamily phosphohydrolase/phosphomutase